MSELTPFRAALLAFTLRKTIADLVADEVKAERGDVFDRLADLHADTGTKQVSVKLPNGDPVATLTITQPSAKEHVNPAALLAWARENRPDWIETIEHPAQEAWTEEKVNPAVARKAGLTVLSDGSVVTDDGEVVDGLTYTTPAPSSFSVKYADGGRDRVIDAWRAGDLAEVDPGNTLPQIGA